MTTVRIELPVHLRTLARLDGVVGVVVDGAPTITRVLDALEARYPVLRGTIRDHATGQRRAYLRYFGDGGDLNFDPPDAPFPAAVSSGADSLRVVGAIAGG